jgi:hypothetical protein
MDSNVLDSMNTRRALHALYKHFLATGDIMYEQPPSPPSQYEFSASQNTTFSSLAGSMKVVAIIMMILGALSALNILMGDVVAALMGGLYIFIGIWTKSAAESIQNIVNTEGNDIDHLMNAVKDLNKLYNLQKWGLIAATVFAFVAGFAMASQGG